MENKVLQENIEQIKQYDKNLADKILMFNSEKSNIQLAQNENGEYNLIFHNNPIHSTISAVDEAKKIVSNIENKTNENSIRIIYGLGLGYLADEFCNFVSGKIIVFEPNIELLKYVLSIAKIDAIFKENFILCSDKETFQKHIQKFIDENTQLSISFLNSYKSTHLDDIKYILNLAQMLQGEIIANKNTFLKRAPRVYAHTIYNLKRIFSSPNISDIKDIYKGKTAIILCAGPSLKENIEIIKNNQDKFVIFALNPTLKLLSENDISPDFIVNIENTDTSAQFSTIDTTKHYCIFEAFSSYAVSKMKTRKTFNYISNDNFFNFWVRDCLKLNDNLESFGTVSYTALKSAFIMGFEKIILVGQDLAYSNGDCYSKECHFSQLQCIYDENEKKYKIIAQDFEKFAQAFIVGKTSLDAAKKIAKRRLEFLNQNITTVKSQENKDIPSQTGYSIFIECFKKAAHTLKSQKPEIKLINSSCGGAQIDGFENIKLEDVVKNLTPIEKLNLDNYSSNIDKNYVLSKIISLKEKTIKYASLNNDFANVCNKLLKELKNKNVFSINCEKLIKKHNQLLNTIISLKTDGDIGFIVNVHLCKFEKYFKTNYFSNVEIAKETLENLINETTKNKENMEKLAKTLGDCESFIQK